MCRCVGGGVSGVSGYGGLRGGYSSDNGECECINQSEHADICGSVWSWGGL